MQDNVILFQKKSKLTKLVDLGGSQLGFYKASVKTHLLFFILNNIKHLDSDNDIINSLKITQEQLYSIKNLRVSQFTIDELFDVCYQLGFLFELQPISKS